MSGFCHLHLHTEYSLLDGAIKIKDLAARLKEMGMTSCAITDHGVMYGAVSFYREMKANGIHPVIGCEVYVAPGSRFDKNVVPGKEDRYYNHLILLAKNNQGLTNLNKLVSAGFTEGFYRRPRIDEELLEKWHDGLICLSACLAGKVPSLIIGGDSWNETFSNGYCNQLYPYYKADNSALQTAHSNKANVIFGDMHVSSVSPGEFLNQPILFFNKDYYSPSLYYTKDGVRILGY